jgi:hypothetical protein
MANGDFITVSVTDARGAPKTDALANGLAFVDYRNRSGTARTQPTFTHVGQGVYRARPTTADVAEGIAWVVSTGTGGFPSRWSGAVCSEAAPFAVFLLTTQADGSLWAGAAPTLPGASGLYVDGDGNARTAPALAAVHAPYLYAVTPSSADLLVGILGKLTMPAGADPSPASAFSFAVPTSVDPAVLSSPEPAGLFQQQITYAAISSRDGAGRPTLGAPSTSRARVQSGRFPVRDFAGELVIARYKVYLPPSCQVTLDHRIWLTSEGDSAGVQTQARRIIVIDKFRDGIAAERYRVVYL